MSGKPLDRSLQQAFGAQFEPSPLAVVAQPMLRPPPKNNKPAKLWELDDAYHCPIIGTCIDASELQRLADKLDFGDGSKQAFTLHVKAVGHCRKRGAVAEGLQKFLDGRYADWLQRFARLQSSDEVLQMWKCCMDNGDVAGPLWAAFTHRHSGAALRQTLFSDMHMLSHQVGATQSADKRRLARLETENAQLRHLADARELRHQQQLNQLRQQISELEQQQQQAQQQWQQAQHQFQRLAQFESGQVYVEMGQQLMLQQAANQQMRSALRKQQQQSQQEKNLQQQLRQSQQREQQLEAERNALERLLLNDATAADTCASCPAAPRNVLYVGGRSAMASHYRQLAARIGIRLSHHDGGQEEALSRLPEMIQGVDAVLCPTDCISHSAYYQLKQHCKRNGTPCLFFRGAGVSSLAAAMERLARGESSVGHAAAPAFTPAALAATSDQD